MQNTDCEIPRERRREGTHHGLQDENLSRQWYDEVRQSVWWRESPRKCHQFGHQQ